MLTIEALTLGYGGKVAVADAALVLETGQIGSLPGPSVDDGPDSSPSGCGKCTLLRTIAGFEKPMAGAVTVDGRTLSTPETLVESEQRRIGMAFEDIALFPHLDVGDISFGLGGYEDRMPHSLCGRRIDGLDAGQRVAFRAAGDPRGRQAVEIEPVGDGIG